MSPATSPPTARTRSRANSVLPDGGRRAVAGARPPPATCCPDLHRAVELVGRRWTGAILWVLLAADRPLRFTDIPDAVPDLSGRLRAERLRELEAHGLVAPADAAPGYVPTRAALALRPALAELQVWGRRWL